MRNLDRTVDWLRPLVDSKVWDYCVVWKSGDDPSRFIEWIGCCCSGCGNVKLERGEELVVMCRDEYQKHPIRTKACEALSYYPLFMSRYSGVYGDVVISRQPKWLFYGNASDSTSAKKVMGTQVLVPVSGGLVEMFSAKNIPKDGKTIELITSLCNVSLEQESMTTPCFYGNFSFINEQCLDPVLVGENLQNISPFLLNLSVSSPKTQSFTPTTQLNTHIGFNRLSFDSEPGYDSLKKSVEKSIGSKRLRHKENQYKKYNDGLVSDFSIEVKKDRDASSQQQRKEKYHSKNLVTERNRRKRIKDGLYTLRSLVPKITQMNNVSILEDAIEYVKELEKEKRKLQDQVNEIEDEDHKSNLVEGNIMKPEGLLHTRLATDHIQSCFSSNENVKPEVSLEVNKISKRDFLIKFFCKQKRGGFRVLMDALDSLGLQVVDANVTTCNGTVLHVLRVEALEDIKQKKLRDSLIKITSWINRDVDRKLNRD